MDLDRLLLEWIHLESVAKSSSLARSVLFNHSYVPPSNIQPVNLYEMLEFLLKRLFYD